MAGVYASREWAATSRRAAAWQAGGRGGLLECDGGWGAARASGREPEGGIRNGQHATRLVRRVIGLAFRLMTREPS